MKTQTLKKQVIKIFQKFGLSKDNALISSNHTNESFSYYHNYSDAEQGNTNAIASPMDYENLSTDPLINPNQIFVRVETVEGCALVSELNLFVLSLIHI